MSSAFIISGTSQIGIGVAACLAQKGWTVRLASRTPPPVDGPWKHVPFDRSEPNALSVAINDGVDLLMDCIVRILRSGRGLLAYKSQLARPSCQSPAMLIRLMPVILPSTLKPNRRLAASPRGKTSFTT